MSAVILPNGSLVFRLPQWTIHVDSGARQIHLRDANSRDELGGSIFATAPVETVRRVFMLPESNQFAHLSLEFVTGEGLDLGRVPLGETGKRIAYAVARVARCGITTSLEPTRPSIARAETPFYEQNTGVLTADGSYVRREGEAETLPRLGWRDEWRDEFIQVGNASQTTIDEPLALTAPVLELGDGPAMPMPTISAELVDPSEASTKRPRGLHEEHEEATIRIDLMRAAS